MRIGEIGKSIARGYDDSLAAAILAAICTDDCIEDGRFPCM